MPTPLSDFWDFLIGNTNDHNDLGTWKYLFVALFPALIIATIFITLKVQASDLQPFELSQQCHGRGLGGWRQDRL